MSIMKWLTTARRNRLKCELCESLMLIHARKFKCAISSYLEFGSNNIFDNFLMSGSLGGLEIELMYKIEPA